MNKRSRGQKKLLAGLILAEFLVLVALVWFLWYLHVRKEEFPWKDYPVAAHALGSLDGRNYLNAREGFQWYYDQGCRMFEVDLAQTSDGVWVCRHQWNKSRGQWKGKKKRVLTSEEFLAAPLFGEYTPMSLADLFDLLMDYPDAYVVLDSKKYSSRNFENTAADFSAFLETARSIGCEEAFSRVIPEVYNEEMYEGLASVYDFSAYLYSFWQETSPEDMERAAAFCKEKGISAVAVSDEYWTDAVQSIFQEQDIMVNVYTVDDPARARALLDAGVAGVCTNTMVPADLQ